MKTKTFVTVLLVAILLASCAPTETSTRQPTLITPSPTIHYTQPLVTPTEFQLPFNDKNVGSEYCSLQVIDTIQLPISGTQGLSDDEIARKLMDLYLAYFNATQAPDWCKVDAYKIDKVYYDEHALAYPPIEPQGDIMRVVRFSIKLVQIPNYWMSLAGEVDQQNWLHAVVSVAIFHSTNRYTIKFANP